MSSASRWRVPFMPVLALSAGILGMCAIWTTIAVLSRSPQAWLGLLAAADMVLLLRLSGVRPGALRSAVAVTGTALAIIASYWMMTATQFGAALGLTPWESAQRLGTVLAFELSRNQAGPYDGALLLIALGLAAVAAYGPRQR